MFNIDEVPRFWVDVEFVTPSGQQATFQAKFEALTIPEFNLFSLETAEGSKAFLDRIFLAFKDVADNAGNDIPDTPENRSKLVALSWVRTALIRSYFIEMKRSMGGETAV